MGYRPAPPSSQSLRRPPPAVTVFASTTPTTVRFGQRSWYRAPWKLAWWERMELWAWSQILTHLGSGRMAPR